jgi:ribosomal protein S10
MTNLIQKIKIESVYRKSLNLYTKFLITILKHHKIKYKQIYLPNKIKTFTLLKSPHVFKKAKEHFGIIKYKSFFKIFLKKDELNNFILKYKVKTLKIQLILEN